MNFKITLNNIDVNSEDIFPYVKDGNVKNAILYMKEKTGCSQEEAYDVYKELKQMVKAKPLQQWERDKYEKEYKQSTQQQNPQKPQQHCPVCNSTNIQKISVASKAVGAGLFGIFSKTARSQFKCKDCGYKF